MTRGLTLIAGILAAGCSTAPPPIREAAPVASEKLVQAAFSPPAKPAASDPAAAKLVAAALAAHTGNDPAKLAKLKAVSLRRTAVATGADGVRGTLDWRGDLLAPDRIRVEARQLAGTTVITLDARGASLSQMTPGGAVKQEIKDERLRDCRSQRSEEEFMLVYPLADPSTVAAPAPDETINGSAAAGAYVWTPALAPALVHFDKATGRIVRVVYRGWENTTELQKEITVRGHAQFDGVWLPTRFELRTNGKLFMEVEEQKFELGKSFPPDHFKP